MPRHRPAQHWIALDAAHPLRLERSLLAQAAAEIAGIAGPGARLKVSDHAPIDGIARLRGAIESRPAGATRGRARRRVLYVSGSTASTLPCEAATAVRLADAARDGGHDVLIFAAAMARIDANPGSRDESAAGAEEAFNLNLLARINRELGGDFDTAGFRHCLRFDPLTQCIESHLVAGTAQRVQALGRRFDFAPRRVGRRRPCAQPRPGARRSARARRRVASQPALGRRAGLVRPARARAGLNPRSAIARVRFRCAHVTET